MTLDVMSIRYEDGDHCVYVYSTEYDALVLHTYNGLVAGVDVPVHLIVVHHLKLSTDGFEIVVRWWTGQVDDEASVSYKGTISEKDVRYLTEMTSSTRHVIASRLISLLPPAKLV
tara:strand:+ start:1299 stop:1643 length:345 start_codon:yes stop_codon:yes gene_type:complete